MVITHVVSEIKKHYDLSNEKSFTRFIKDILDYFNFSDYADNVIDDSDLQNKNLVSGKIQSDGLEFSKGLTIEDLGRNKDLVAAHNLSEDKLLTSINLGSFNMLGDI